MRGLAALRHRDYRLFYSALVIAGLGSTIVRTATLFEIYELTGSPLHLGLISLANGLPTIGLSLIGGVIADRADRRRVLMLTQFAAGLLGLVAGAVAAHGSLAVWHLYALTLAMATLAAANGPARTAMIPSLVPAEDLLNAFALNSTAWRLAAMAGPALSGAAIALFGLPVTYALIGATSIGAVLALAAMRPTLPPKHTSTPRAPRAPTAAHPHAQRSVFGSALEGLAFVRAKSIILVLLSLDAAAQFFGGYRALLPVFADQLGAGPQGFGILVSASAVGGLIGAAVLLGMRRVPYTGLVVAGAVLLYCLALVVLAISPSFPLSLGAVLVLGMADAVNAIPRNAVIQKLTPDELRGRVGSLQTTFVAGVPPLGEAQSGALAALVGAPLALIAGAVACAAYVIGLLLKRPDLRAPDL